MTSTPHLPFSVFVPGEPKGQPRPRAWAMKIGKNADGSDRYQARMYEAGTAEAWKAQIAAACKDYAPFIPIQGALCLSATFYFPRPRAHYRSGKMSDHLKPDAPLYHTSKPDRDNLDKAVLDTLKTLGFFSDDAQIVGGKIWKLYCNSCTPRPGVRIEIRRPADFQEPEPAARKERLLPL